MNLLSPAGSKQRLQPSSPPARSGHHTDRFGWSSWRSLVGKTWSWMDIVQLGYLPAPGRHEFETLGFKQTLLLGDSLGLLTWQHSSLKLDIVDITEIQNLHNRMDNNEEYLVNIEYIQCSPSHPYLRSKEYPSWVRGYAQSNYKDT